VIVIRIGSERRSSGGAFSRRLPDDSEGVSGDIFTGGSVRDLCPYMSHKFGLADQFVELARALVGKATEVQLADRLRKELGPCGKVGNGFEEDCEVECPRCGSGAAYRKGTRPRTMEVPRLGAVEVERPYLECRVCGRSYVPYEAGAPERCRYAQEALRRPIEATMETSYRRGAEAYPESPSARTLWRIVDEGPPPTTKEEGPLDADAEALRGPERTCVADATRIPAREEGPLARKDRTDRSTIASQSLTQLSPTGPEGPAAVQP